jgi:hypothetical protein
MFQNAKTLCLSTFIENKNAAKPKSHSVPKTSLMPLFVTGIIYFDCLFNIIFCKIERIN